MSLRYFIAFAIAFFACLATSFSQKDVELQQAVSLEANGQSEEAISIYKDYLKRNKTEQAYSLLCNALQNNGNFEEAEDYLKEAGKIFPKQSDFGVKLFLLYEQTGKSRKAEKQFERLLKNLKANNSDILKLGNAFLYSRHFEEAKKVFLRGRELLGDNSAYGFQLGNIFMQENNYEAIAKEYLLLLEHNPQSLPQITANLSGLFAKDSVNLVKAVEEEWSRLYKRQSRNPYFARFGLWLYTQNGKYDKAFSMAKNIDKTFEESSGSGVLDFAENMNDANALSIAKQAYEYVLNKGKESAFHQRALLGYTSVLYKEFMKTPSNKKALALLMQSFELVFSEYGYNRDSFTTILQAAEIMAFHDTKAQDAVDLLEKCQGNNSFSINQKAEMKLLSAEIYNKYGDSWQANLLCSQVEKDCKNSPLSDRAKFFKAMLSYYNGEIEWALSQFKALRASTTKLISNDALEYSILIEENRDEDSTFTAMRWFAAAEREREYRNYDKALNYTDSIEQAYFHHPLFDECVYLRALIAKDRGNIEMADSLLKSLLLKYPYDLTADDAIMQLAEIAEVYHKDLSAAKSYYEQLILNYPTSLYVTQARKKYKELEKFGKK